MIPRAGDDDVVMDCKYPLPVCLIGLLSEVFDWVFYVSKLQRDNPISVGPFHSSDKKNLVCNRVAFFGFISASISMYKTWKPSTLQVHSYIYVMCTFVYIFLVFFHPPALPTYQSAVIIWSLTRRCSSQGVPWK